MLRRIMIVCGLCAAAAGAVAATRIQTTPPAAEAPEVAPITAEAFAALLVNAVKDTLSANAAVVPADLAPLLEQALEAVFVQSNAEPDVVVAGVAQARDTLTSTGVMCEASSSTPTKTCEAVAVAFVLAQAAAEAASTAAIDGTPNAGIASRSPSLSDGGGAGGGVTHPPVSTP